MKLKQQLEQLQHEEASFCPSYAHNSHQQQQQQQQYEGASFCPSGVPTACEDSKRHPEGASFHPSECRFANNNTNIGLEQVASVMNTSMFLLSQVMSYHAEIFKPVQPVGEAALAHHQATQPISAQNHEDLNPDSGVGEAGLAHHQSTQYTSELNHEDLNPDSSAQDHGTSSAQEHDEDRLSANHDDDPRDQWLFSYPRDEAALAHHSGTQTTEADMERDPNNHSERNQDGDPDTSAFIDDAICNCRNPRIKKYSFRSSLLPCKSSAKTDTLLDEREDPHSSTRTSSFPVDEAAFAHRSANRTGGVDALSARSGDLDEALRICRNPRIKKYSFRSSPALGKTLEARFSRGELFIKIVNAVRDFHNDVLFRCIKGGLQAQATDRSGAAILSVFLLPVAFSSFKCERPLGLGINIRELVNISCNFDRDSELNVYAATATGLVSFQSANFAVSVPASCLHTPSLQVPDSVFSHKAVLQMPVTTFSEMCFSFEEDGPVVAVKVTVDRVALSTKGFPDTRLVFPDPDSNEIDTFITASSPFTLYFPVQLVIRCVKASAFSDRVTIGWSPDAHMMVQYDVIKGNSREDIGLIQFQLSPSP